MEMVQKLKDRYAAYAEELAKVYASAKPGDGLFGWGDDPKKNPCHMNFYEDAERWTKEFLSADREASAVFEAVRFMVTEPAAHREQHCFWFMYAAHGLTREMIPLLTMQQCAQLRDFYDEHYPKRDRMPVQKEVYKLLKKGAGKEPGRGGFLW